MLPGLASWRRQLLPDGVAFAHPAGIDRGALHVRDRLRPLRAIRALGQDTLARMPPTLRDGALSAPRYFTTMEGEYAAAITLTARFADGGPYVRVLAVVYADDWQRQIDAYLVRPSDGERAALVDRVDALARHTCLGLGVRRRRFRYTPPPGWHGRAAGLVARWFAPGFPREAATIVVAPACPVDEDARIAALERMLLESGPVAFEPEGPPEVIPVTTTDGMSGELTRQVGHYPGQPRALLVGAELIDGRHAYRLTLEAMIAHAAAVEPVFHAMVRSVARLPERASVAPAASAMSHWVD